MKRREGRGFTLVELLVSLAIIGIILAIGIPQLMGALQKAKQKKSMADMRNIATAIEAYAIDFRNYPPSAMQSVPVVFGGIAYPTRTLGLTKPYITPTYLKIIPLVDGWSSWYLYNASDPDYAIVSCGRDGICMQPASGGPTSNFNTDIVYSDGQFTVYPEGAQE
jgi:general secretion pathway protein G